MKIANLSKVAALIGQNGSKVSRLVYKWVRVPVIIFHKNPFIQSAADIKA